MFLSHNTNLLSLLQDKSLTSRISAMHAARQCFVNGLLVGASLQVPSQHASRVLLAKGLRGLIRTFNFMRAGDRAQVLLRGLLMVGPM